MPVSSTTSHTDINLKMTLPEFTLPGHPLVLICLSLKFQDSPLVQKSQQVGIFLLWLSFLLAFVPTSSLLRITQVDFVGSHKHRFKVHEVSM